MNYSTMVIETTPTTTENSTLTTRTTNTTTTTTKKKKKKRHSTLVQRKSKTLGDRTKLLPLRAATITTEDTRMMILPRRSKTGMILLAFVLGLSVWSPTSLADSGKDGSTIISTSSDSDNGSGSSPLLQVLPYSNTQESQKRQGQGQLTSNELWNEREQERLKNGLRDSSVPPIKSPGRERRLRTGIVHKGKRHSSHDNKGSKSKSKSDFNDGYRDPSYVDSAATTAQDDPLIVEGGLRVDLARHQQLTTIRGREEPGGKSKAKSKSYHSSKSKAKSVSGVEQDDFFWNDDDNTNVGSAPTRAASGEASGKGKGKGEVYYHHPGGPVETADNAHIFRSQVLLELHPDSPDLSRTATHVLETAFLETYNTLAEQECDHLGRELKSVSIVFIDHNSLLVNAKGECYGCDPAAVNLFSPPSTTLPFLNEFGRPGMSILVNNNNNNDNNFGVRDTNRESILAGTVSSSINRDASGPDDPKLYTMEQVTMAPSISKQDYFLNKFQDLDNILERGTQVPSTSPSFIPKMSIFPVFVSENNEKHGWRFGGASLNPDDPRDRLLPKKHRTFSRKDRLRRSSSGSVYDDDEYNGDSNSNLESEFKATDNRRNHRALKGKGGKGKGGSCGSRSNPKQSPRVKAKVRQAELAVATNTTMTAAKTRMRPFRLPRR